MERLQDSPMVPKRSAHGLAMANLKADIFAASMNFMQGQKNAPDELSKARAMQSITPYRLYRIEDYPYVIAAEATQRALYVLEGDAQLDGSDIPDKQLVLLDAGTRHRLRAKTPLKAMLFGGEPLDAPRHMWWNFVSSSKDRIEQAKDDWQAGRFGLIPGDDVERIPLPAR